MNLIADYKNLDSNVFVRVLAQCDLMNNYGKISWEIKISRNAQSSKFMNI